MSRIMRELVAAGRAARGVKTGEAAPCTPEPPGEWPFPGAAPTPTPTGASAVCFHGIGMFDRCFACGRWGGVVDGDGDQL